MHPKALVQACRNTVLITTAAVGLASAPVASGALVDANFRSFFNLGYYIKGNFTFDDGFATVTAFGVGPTNGLEALSVSFFDSSTRIATFSNVTNGVSSYEYLKITFDTTSLSFSGEFDVGMDGGGAGEYYVDGTIGALGTFYDVDPVLNTALDTADPWIITVAEGVAPAPGALALLAAGLLGLRLSRRRA
jgi:hypothetical protein